MQIVCHCRLTLADLADLAVLGSTQAHVPLRPALLLRRACCRRCSGTLRFSKYKQARKCAAARHLRGCCTAANPWRAAHRACLVPEGERVGKYEDGPTHWSRWEKRQLVGMDRLTSIGA